MPDWKPGMWNGSRAAWSPSWIAAQRAVDAVNADMSTPAVAQLVDGEAENEPRHCGCFPPNTCEACSFTKLASSDSDDDEGLPALAEGSRWDGEGYVCDDGCSARYSNPEYKVDCVVFVGDTHWIGDVRYLIARHDRQRGCYWADELRALAGELLREARSIELDNLLKGFPSRLPALEQQVHDKRDAAHRILSILDRLHAEGVC